MADELKPAEPVSDDRMAAVLREHIAFLREQLTLWQSEAGLAAHWRKRAEALEAELKAARIDDRKLRASLAMACGEILAHETCEDNPHETDADMFSRWRALSEGG